MSQTWHQLIGDRRKWERVRREVLERAGHRCQVRGPRCTGKATTVDHVLSLADGGHPTDLGNLRASCRPCNALLAGQTGNRRERANRAGWRRNDSDPSPAFSGDGPPFSVLTPEERYAAGYCSRVW